MIITGITYRCNFNCLFCLDRKNKCKPSPSLCEIKKLFKTIHKIENEDTIMLMNGESFIRSDFFEVLAEARKYGLKVNVTTNGSMLSYYNFLVKVVEGGVGQLVISLHSHIPKIANTISRNNFCYYLQRKTLLNIDIFNTINEKKINHIDINTVICKLNYRHLEGLVFYLKDLLMHTHFRIKFKFMCLGGNDINFYNKMLPSIKDIEPYILKILNILGKEKAAEKIAFSGFPLCAFPYYEWACVELYENLYRSNLYLINSYNFKDVKNQQDMVINDFYKYKECRDCSLYRICLGVRADYVKVYPDFNLILSKRNPKEVLDAVHSNLAFSLAMHAERHSSPSRGFK